MIYFIGLVLLLLMIFIVIFVLYSTNKKFKENLINFKEDIMENNFDYTIKATITTSKGNINLNLMPAVAPITVANFMNLADNGYYDGLKFHRVIADFMIQGGCPQGTGTGGPGYNFKDEYKEGVVFDKPGLLAMANSGPNTNGSQFFITHIETPWLNYKHTIFGEVVDSADQEIVDAVAQGDLIETIKFDGEVSEFKEAAKEIFEQLSQALKG